RLSVGREFRSYLAGIPHSIRHTQAISCQITKAASVVTTAGGNQTGSSEKALSRQNRSSWRRVLAIIALIGCRVFRPQTAGLHVRQNPRPKLHAIAYGKRVGMWCTFCGTRQHVQSAQHDLASAAAVPLRELK